MPMKRARWQIAGLAVAVAALTMGLAACQREPQSAPTPASAPAAAPPAAPASSAAAPPAAAAPVGIPAALQERADALLAAHRQMIVLMTGERTLDAAGKRAIGAVGQMLFHDMQERQRALIAQAGEMTDPATVPALNALLDRIESEPSWFDADRLAFKEFLGELSTRYSQAQSLPGLKLGRRASEDLAVLAEIEQAYDRELKDVFGRFAQRGIEPKREKWADYVAKLQALYSREQILKDFGTIVPYTLAPQSAGGGKEAKEKEGADTREIFGTSLPPKTVVLTFDDGPHARHTDEILEILKRYDAPGIFFELGQNLGKLDAQGKAQLGANGAVAKRVLAAGHTLANHSFSHGMMAKMTDDAVRNEATETEALLDATGRPQSTLFRFPYGARNEAKLTTVEALKLRSMLWTVDSMDWADPVPKSIADRVLAEVDKAKRGVILFHDIQGRTVQALPTVLDQLVADGYRFATWRDGKFVVNAAKRPAPDDGVAATAGDTLYRESHALVIGIDKYAQWPGLHHAVTDAKAMEQQLVTRLGFKPENVTALYDAQATRANILRVLNDKLTDPKRVKRDDRVLVFFAGHGSTRKLASGRDVGYIVPVDATSDDLAADAISMPQLQEVAEALSAKHVLFMIDACYSGLGLTRGGGPRSSKNFLSDNARRIGRQMITAGGADQQVADDGPGGHSVFTWTMLQALSGKADLNGDGVITGTELAAYVSPAVSAIARQTPAFGSLPGSEGGEFVFELPAEREGLSGDSLQLDAAASQVNKRIDEANEQAVHTAAVPKAGAAGASAAAAPAIEVVVKNLDGADAKLTMPAAAPLSPRVAAQRANDRGLQLYRERRYDEAEAAFTEALKLQPRFALAANNLGFVYFKRGKPVEAARWFEQAIEMDGSRALAYLNLGDAYLQAGNDAKALAAYTTFVGLAPKHPRIAALQAWIATPDAAHRPPLPTTNS
ncbi:Peptidoglycan/xylan/chitin deacetylase, PgdA/CDA1 family [Variovorax sp. OK605]|uniref:polysaccharide deacetylase family protein n=1 Tax=Variovorax sp. OK605 TaxID=1855317 RepID=UPI0008E61E65|nr:polysaccharide deacetylase family protein [Variovorax sp. OK605]SFO52486.1 Peptidoglycan/xylan/chitin deacetylase, PgdA/CDA1 family [Variovorax sp. OK605]